MLAEERRLQLVVWSKTEGRLDALEASNRLNVAVETIRRDLDVLQRRGVVKRVHGGAIPIERFSKEANRAERKVSNSRAKALIAEAASAFIPENGCIFVDGGSTTELLWTYLRDKPSLLVVTNSITLASLIGESATQVILLGGEVRATSLSTTGNLAVDELQNFHAQVAFIGVNGISDEAGLTTADIGEAAVKRAMIANAAERILLADHSKFGNSFTAKFATPRDFDHVVSDSDTPKDFLSTFRDSECEVVLA
jgi:DeoR family fructose operon transcriptional repressor